MNRTPLQRDTSFEGVMDYIRGAILDRTYPPGMQLKQSLIASQLGVSQGPIREALVHLVGEGLVENVPYHGMFVRRISKKDVEEIYQLRTALESLAIELALPAMDEKKIAELEQTIEKIVNATRIEDYDTAVLEDLHFHRCLIEMSSNSRLIRFWDSLLTQSRFVLRNLYSVQEQSLRSSLALNHAKILNAIRTANITEIRETIQEHMAFASSRLLALISE